MIIVLYNDHHFCGSNNVLGANHVPVQNADMLVLMLLGPHFTCSLVRSSIKLQLLPQRPFCADSRRIS